MAHRRLAITGFPEVACVVKENILTDNPLELLRKERENTDIYFTGFEGHCVECPCTSTYFAIKEAKALVVYIWS